MLDIPMILGPRLPSARARSASTQYGDTFFVVGGLQYDASMRPTSRYRSLYKFDNVAWKWSIASATAMADAKSDMAAFRVDDKGAFRACSQA